VLSVGDFRKKLSILLWKENNKENQAVDVDANENIFSGILFEREDHI